MLNLLILVITRIFLFFGDRSINTFIPGETRECESSIMPARFTDVLENFFEASAAQSKKDR